MQQRCAVTQYWNNCRYRQHCNSILLRLPVVAMELRLLTAVLPLAPYRKNHACCKLSAVPAVVTALKLVAGTVVYSPDPRRVSTISCNGMRVGRCPTLTHVIPLLRHSRMQCCSSSTSIALVLSSNRANAVGGEREAWTTKRNRQ